MAFDRPRRLFNLLIVVGFATLPDVARDTVYAAEPESTSSAAQNPLGALPQLDVTKARILFFRPGSFVGMAADARIRIDGKTVGWVGSGSAVFVDHAPGDILVGIGGPDRYTASDFVLTLAPGKEYFVTLAAEAHPGFGVLPFIIGKGIDAARHVNEQHCGYGWCAGVVDRSAALPELAPLSLSGPNPNAN
jgi:hypothetical protein